VKKSELNIEYEKTLQKLDTQKKKSAELRKRLKELQHQFDQLSVELREHTVRTYDLKQSLSEERRQWALSKVNVAAINPNPALIEKINELEEQNEKLKATVHRLRAETKREA
jgi:chromosome segregation ATPase